MSWRVTVRTKSSAPDGKRHLPPPQESFDVDDLLDVAYAMARFTPDQVVYVMVVPIGGELHQWQEATRG